jgi:sugar phosphate isomerase/epimerase
MRRTADRLEVKIPLIMVDAEGSLGASDAAARKRAVRDHFKWVYIASDLGCHSIRVNWAGAERGAERDPAIAKAFIDRSVDAFGELVAMGQQNEINIIIENHGGPSSYPDLLVQLMKAVGSPRLGTLPDFGNFPSDVDRYEAVDKMMPFAKAVSAKCYDFGEDGNETTIDFERMLQICVDQHGYHGFIGIEFEGRRLSERDGIRAARDLLIKLRG